MSDDDCIIIEDDTNYRSITCERIPELFLDKLVAKNHFGKYGKISRFVLRPNRLSCTVDYEREEEAANAIENGTVYNGHEFTIRYSQREVGHVRHTEEWVDPDVQAELDAMGNHARRMPIPVSKLPQPAPRIVKQKPPRTVPDPQITQATRISNAVQSELEAILRKPAYSDEDKYRILDARDKLIRLTTVRTTDISKVVSIKGTCPDMCPEKERYMREFQHQVSNFEMEDEGSRSGLNHSIAIKEYSRSSADQEVPLVHELRPEPVLKMTMLYLMHRIMGLCDIEEVNTGDWFHFVWDRTRSIRKDITQQELCSTGAVHLVEQCARFHIHCAARLVAEDPSVFDQKINTENLTKCLQTLKYMYNDLRIKGIRCDNEAEFRGYIVLLNLNDANFLWELQNLPEDIQNSKEVRSAIAFYKCMESNNYVRFFNLVRETTYMNACILLRYFTQVRLKALKMIIKAYNWPRHLVSLPLEYLTKILGFESDDAASDFFSDCGLDCDAQRIRLDKNAFEEPDVPFLLNRAFEVVESKRQVGVGQAVCGLPLESPSIFENHQPHNSFDANGYLRFEAFTADDQLKGDGIRKTPPRTQTDNVFKIPTMSPPMTPKQQLKSVFASISPKTEIGLMPSPLGASSSTLPSDSIFDQRQATPVTSSTTASIFKIPLPAPPVEAPTTVASMFAGSVFNQNSASSGNIFGGSANNKGPTKQNNNTFGSKPQPFSNDNIFQHFDAKPLEFDTVKLQSKDSNLEQQTELEKQRKQLEESLLKIEEEKEAKIKEQKELEQQRQAAEEMQHQKHLEEKRRKTAVARVAKNSEKILSELLDEAQRNLLAEVAAEELQRHLLQERLVENVILDFISEYISQIHSEELTIMRRDQSLVYRYFHAWRDLTHKKLTQRQLIATVPVWMTTDTLDQQAEKIAHPRQAENLHMIKRYRLGFPCDFRILLEDEEPQRPIDIFKYLLGHFRSKENHTPSGFLKRRKYFKLVISLPGERDELPGFNSYSNNWLNKNVELKSVDSSPAFVCHCEDDLALCVRKVSCIVPRNEENQRVSNECDHADGVLFLMSPGNSMNSRKRLHHLLKLTDLYRALPVAILAFNAAEDASIEVELELDSLVDDGKISSFHMFHSSDHFLKRDFKRALDFLATSDNFSCSLEAQSFVEFLNTCLGPELWQRLQKSWLINPSFRKICSTPRFLVAVYNEAINNLIEVIDEDFQDYPEFPEDLRQFVPETKFENPVTLEQFPINWKDVNRTKKIINFLKKLKLPSIKVDLPREIDSLEIWLLNYTSACISNNDELATKAGYHTIKCLIEELNNEDLQDLPVDQRLDLISWLPIIREAALAILNHQWIEENHRLPLQIIYNRQEFMDFQSEPWWLDSELVKSVKMSIESGENGVEEEVQMRDDIDAIIARAEKASSLADEKLKQLQKDIHSTRTDPELTRELDEALYNFEVSEKCRSFEIPPSDENDDSLELPPVAKKFKGDTDKMDMDQIIERAFSIIRKAEDMMDDYRRPMMEIQTFETD